MNTPIFEEVLFGLPSDMVKSSWAGTEFNQ
jgi:hypothetical protein